MATSVMIMTLTRIEQHLPDFTKHLMARPVELRTEWVLLELASALEHIARLDNQVDALMDEE